MTRIAIVGSKPSSALPIANVYFFANGAVGMYRSRLNLTTPVVGIMSQEALNIDGPDQGDKDHRRVTAKLIQDVSMNTAVIICSSPIERSVNLNSDRVVFVSRRDVRALSRRVLGSSYFARVLLTASHRPSMSLFRQTAKSVITTRFSRFADYPPDLRPSMGLVAVALAVSVYGSKAEYCVSGIGISDRETYAYRSRSVASRESDGSHVSADIVGFKSLAKRIDITTTSDELASACAIPHVGA